MPRILIALTLALTAAIGPALAQTEETPDAQPEVPQIEVEPPMTMARLGAIMTLIDEAAVVEPGGISLTVANVPVTIIGDPRANRMRILVPISSAAGLTEAEMLRILQANFDTALDARYAVANDRLWSTFIHPLAELTQDQVISGLAQTVTLAQTYGDTYTSGAIMFGGGDTRSLIEELRNLGEEL
ncbi:hypothetical protein [Hasllibacter sp. MH4015]|uniref:hypothetical protein n=1 Tax=Hasllibacter sp. MH4015 TaxID=2854029 RepID=UPI001CD4E93F|nr:hypothetical protein [Hasllibacter sp. MH4015]